jgi:isopenicillin N synthase-like dioxygenase
MADIDRHVAPIDLQPFRLGGPSDRDAVVGAVDDACRGSGFLRVTGHGVDPELVDRMLSVSAAFFDLPLEEKRRCVVADPEANRGYSAEGSEALAYSLGEDVERPDLFEALNVGRDHAEGTVFDTHRRWFAPNVWPERPAELRAVWLEYQRAIDAVQDVLLEVFALALDLEPTFFVDRTRNAVITMRAINYERRAGSPAPAPGQLRMGAHTDYGILTILAADDVPGLQVWRDETWHDVRVPPGAFVVNIGDLLAQWTNDRWTSTLHRVVPPPATATGAVRRRSVARFNDADPDCVVTCLPSCCSAERPARYEPVVAGEWLMAKVLGPRLLRPSEVGTSRAERPGVGAGHAGPTR